MLIVGKNYSKFCAALDQQLSVKEHGLKLLIPAKAITPVDVIANGLCSGKFEILEKSILISGMCYISVFSSSQLNKPLRVKLEYCANITNNKQA